MVFYLFVLYPKKMKNIETHPDICVVLDVICVATSVAKLWQNISGLHEEKKHSDGNQSRLQLNSLNIS